MEIDFIDITWQDKYFRKSAEGVSGEYSAGWLGWKNPFVVDQLHFVMVINTP